MDFMSRDQREPNAHISVQDCVNIEVGSLHKYVGGSSERLLMARPRGLMVTKDENILDEGGGGGRKVLVRELRLTSYRNKSLHAGTGQFSEEHWGC